MPRTLPDGIGLSGGINAQRASLKEALVVSCGV